MSQVKANSFTDASGGSNAVLYGVAAPANSMGFRNRIINGDMRIDQRNAGASVTPASFSYTLDRWRVVQTAASKFSVQRNAGSVTPPPGYSSYLGVTSLSAFSATSDVFAIYQPIEGLNTSDLQFGSATASVVTLSFWVRSSLTGTFGGTIKNGTGNRSYPFTYTISAANTWEQKSITMPGDTAGSWATDNSIGISVVFGLGVAASSSGSAGSWIATDVWSATGATSVVGTNGATFYITGVQLEAGSVASPFERRDYGRELIMCQRYYFKTFPNTTAPAQNAGTGGSVLVVPAGSGAGWMVFNLFMPVQMRTAPTVTTFNPSAANANWSNSAVAQVADTTDARILLNNSSGGSAGTSGYLHVTASAEL